jgi:hypothetical protein
MYLRKLNQQYDINRLLPLLDQVEWDSHGRAAINEPTGHWLYDPYKIKDQWRGTEFETLAEEMPVGVSEIRLMKLEAGAVYRSHADIDDRVHLNLQSNEQCYLIDLDNQNMYPVVADNELYIMDGSYLHTAVNFGSSPRIQLVMRIPLERHRNSEFKSFYIEFVDPPHNLRYKVDQAVSPWLNRYVKYGLIDFFDEVSPTKFHLIASETVLTHIQDLAQQANLTIQITSLSLINKKIGII